MALEVRGYSPLTNAGTEMLTVKQLLSGQILQDQAYTSKNLHDSLTKNEYAIVHLTTHGAFGATPGESFLATYDGELSFDELQNLISMGRFRQQPVELLTLSACETAVGNNKAALGLAGVAVKSGARSALASLWLVDDAATTELMAEFYRELIPESRSKSSALRVSQVKLLKQHNTSHPAYWAPFVLIGNWL
jgi:CHAT domain-containing protein